MWYIWVQFLVVGSDLFARSADFYIMCIHSPTNKKKEKGIISVYFIFLFF